MTRRSLDLVSRKYEYVSILDHWTFRPENKQVDLPDAAAIALWGANMGEGELILGLVYLGEVISSTP